MAKPTLSLFLILSLFFFPSCSPRLGGLALYKDPNRPIELRVADLLSRMTIAEKIGQMTQIDRTNASLDVLRDLAIGSVLNGGDSSLGEGANPTMWVDMVDGFQKWAMSSRLGIPLIYGTDAVHGHSNVVGATIFPHNIGLGAARDEDLILRIGRVTALELRATGIPYTFAPSVAVCRDPRWGRCYESYSEDTDIVISMAAIIKGLQGSPPPNHTSGYPFVHDGGLSVAACAKHFTGDGGTEDGVDESNTIATYDDLYRIHIRPYVEALAMGVSTIMVSYSSWNGVKMHTNGLLLTKLLKQDMAFQGLLISDWEGVDRITTPAGSHYKESVKSAINAGIDMIMVPYDYPRFIGDLTELVASGDVSIPRIDDAVRRILRVKFAAGLFERPMADRSLINMVGHEKHRELAREAVRKSLVLLKNGNGNGEKPMLPLSKGASKILVAGIHANSIGYQCGGWTITWTGSTGNNTKGTTILEGIKSAVSERTQVMYEEKPDENFFKKNRNVSYAIVAVGEAPYVETGGDDPNLTLSIEAIEIIERVCHEVKCLVIIISGRPLVIEPYIGGIDAVVAAWLPGSEAGKGISDVIFGDYEFQGRLPRTWFRRVDQLPMNVGDPNYDPLYPFGFGLNMDLRPRKESTVISFDSNSSFSS